MQKILFILLFFASSCFSQEPIRQCDIGPITKTIGGSSWLIYGCSDQSIVLVSAPGSPAYPFYFFFGKIGEGYEMVGEGTGNKVATKATYTELTSFSNENITKLYKEAVLSKNKK